MLIFLDWIEKHPVFVELIKWTILVFGAWFLGIFRIIKKYTQNPVLSLFESPRFCFIEEYQKDGLPARLAVFIVNPCIRNPSNDSYEIDSFTLGYECEDKKIAFQQNLLPISFPTTPQCQLDENIKYLPVYFTNFGSLAGVDSIVEARRKKSGYILFVAKTYGTWKPEYRDGNIRISIKIGLVGNKTLECKENLRISFSKE
ncbi:MAG TPA: hypothetical protein VLS94_01295 [Fusibacter sp.]|nr:hypothetical protein [Fusibacter sp.]